MSAHWYVPSHGPAADAGCAKTAASTISPSGSIATDRSAQPTLPKRSTIAPTKVAPKPIMLPGLRLEAGQHRIAEANHGRVLVAAKASPGLEGHFPVEVGLDLTQRDLAVAVAIFGLVGPTVEGL